MVQTVNAGDVESGSHHSNSCYGSLEDSTHSTSCGQTKIQQNERLQTSPMTPILCTKNAPNTSNSSLSAFDINHYSKENRPQGELNATNLPETAAAISAGLNLRENDCSDDNKKLIPNISEKCPFYCQTDRDNSRNMPSHHSSYNVTLSSQHGVTHHPAHQEHLAKSRQYYRDMMLGVNDGLVSTFLLVAGVVGGGMDVQGVLLTSISGAIAGAISMFAGEFVATKSQNEVMDGEIKLEHDHILNYHTEEMQELSGLLSLIGLPSSSPNLSESDLNTGSTDITEALEIKRRITKFYGSNPDALLKIMTALEFGVIDDEVRSPLVAGATSLSLFFIGALPSTIPFAFVHSPFLGLLVAGLATGLGLLFVGAVKTWATRGNLWLAAMENLLITVAGGGVAYGVGVGFQNLIGEGNSD